MLSTEKQDNPQKSRLLVSFTVLLRGEKRIFSEIIGDVFG